MSLNVRAKLPGLMASLAACLLCTEIVQAQGLPPEFLQRVQQAKTSPESNAYRQMVFKLLGNDIGHIMQQCFPRGTPADAKVFIVIGNVLPNRTLTDVEVQPTTKMTRCFE